MKYLPIFVFIISLSLAASAMAISFGGTNARGMEQSKEVINCGGSCACTPQDRQDATCETFGDGPLTCVRCTVTPSNATDGSRCDRGWTGEVCSATMSEHEATEEARRRAWRNCQGLQCLAFQHMSETIVEMLLRMDPETFDVEQFINNNMTAVPEE